MRIGFAPKSILELNYKKYKETFDPQNMVQIPAGLEHVFASYSNFCEVCEKKKEKEKNEETFTKFCSLVSCEQLKRIPFKFDMWRPLYGEQLHCKFGGIRLKHHGAMCE